MGVTSALLDTDSGPSQLLALSLRLSHCAGGQRPSSRTKAVCYPGDTPQTHCVSKATRMHSKVEWKNGIPSTRAQALSGGIQMCLQEADPGPQGRVSLTQQPHFPLMAKTQLLGNHSGRPCYLPPLGSVLHQAPRPPLPPPGLLTNAFQSSGSHHSTEQPQGEREAH